MKQMWCMCVLTAMMITVSSCARKIAFTKSVVVPSANGQVKVKKDKNNNYDINVFVRDLTTPVNLVPPRKMYIVWSQTNQNGIINMGELSTSRSIVSRGFKAGLSTVSPYKPTRVFITAEDARTVSSPGTQVVLTTEDF
jgi:hypothetical protein